MASFPEPVEYKIVRNVQSVRTYVTELDQSNTPNGCRHLSVATPGRLCLAIQLVRFGVSFYRLLSTVVIYVQLYWLLKLYF